MTQKGHFVLRCGAAAARGTHLGGGVLEVVYTGPITPVSFSALKAAVLEQSSGAAAMVLRMEGAAVLLDESAHDDVQPYRGHVPPAAVVSCHGCYEYWSAYTRRLAALGTMRAVFLPENLALARFWAARHATVRL